MKLKIYVVSLIFLFVLSFSARAQSVLINERFVTNALPAGVTSDGTIFPTKAADGVCTIGMIQVNSGGYLQANVASCGLFTINMKSTSSATRVLSIKYKKEGEAAYTTVSTTLAVSVAASYNLTSLFPVLAGNIPISVRIEPTNGNIQIHDLYVEASGSLNNAAEITAFKLPGQTGNEIINSAAGTVSINVLSGTSLTSVVPQSVVISPQATITPAIAVAQNFTVPVSYTVIAQNGATIKNWTVNVTQVASSAKEVTAFKLSNSQIGNAVINSAAGTITVNMPVGSPLNNLTPVSLTVSPNATINPLANAALNFSTPVVYTVTAQDNSTKTFTVNVTLVDPNAVFTDYQAEEADFTGSVDNNHLNFTGTGFINFLAADNFVTFTVCQQMAGSQTAKFRYSLASDVARKGRLFVNDGFIKELGFARTSTFDEWLDETAIVSLVAGINKIKIVWDTTDGPNVDKLMLTGAPCASYTLNVTATNGGTFSISPARTNLKYFEGEMVTLLANSTPALRFDNWSGDLTGSVNPSTINLNSNKTIIANFTAIPTYKLTTVVYSLGQITVSPPGGEYAAGTVVTLTAKEILGSTFTGWSGDLSGTMNPITITMNGPKTVVAAFTSTYNLSPTTPIGFVRTPGGELLDGALGGRCVADTLKINGPAEFNKLAESLYYRQQAFKNRATTNGIKFAPLVILLKQGVYDGTQTLSVTGAKAFANSMLDIAEQGELTFLGETGVVFKIGINVKRSWNVLIRNMFFQDYFDDGVNIGGLETHHIWVDHCTFGNPVGLPADSEHPDGGCDIKEGASYVTVSWCVFRNSWKTSLVGHSDNNGAEDIGRLKVTYANNYFLGTNSRNPRVRFGEVHVLNNLFENIHLYGTAAANSAYVYAENNFYLNTDWAMYADRSSTDFKAVFGNNSDDVFTSKTGNYPALGLKQTGNEYDDSGLPVITAQIKPAMLNPGGRSVKFDELNPGNVFNPLNYYAYTPLTAAEVRVIVPIFAGADKLQFSPPCALLPLKLLSFNVVLSANTKQAEATWQTTNEVNARYFSVERSTDGRNFVAIGNVPASSGNGTNSYSYTDAMAATGLSYYRLKQFDNDGRFTYSTIIALNNKKIAGFAAYPNPASNAIKITHAAAKSGSNIRITSVDGRTVMQLKVAQGTTITSADVTKLAAGNYLIIFNNGEEKLVTKFVKQ